MQSGIEGWLCGSMIVVSYCCSSFLVMALLSFMYLDRQLRNDAVRCAPHGPHIDPYGDHMGPLGPYGSIWVHMGAYGSIWVHMGPYGLHMGPFRPTWAQAGRSCSSLVMTIRPESMHCRLCSMSVSMTAKAHDKVY